jgi:hypothetical protein
VAGSGISQGSGAITTRSDVELSVESLPGTSRARLGAVGEAVSAQLSAIRACYSKVTSQRPTKEGSLRIELRLPQAGGRAKVELASDEVGDQELASCVVKALRAVDLSALQGPAGGLVVVDFANTAARGARIVAAERSQPAEELVERTADGRPQARARTPGGEVTITITGEGSTSAEALLALHRNVQARIGSLLDCRRRASRQGMNPAGEIVVSFRVGPQGIGQGREISSSVQDQVAPTRLINSLRQAVRGERQAAGQYRVTVLFAGN